MISYFLTSCTLLAPVKMFKQRTFDIDASMMAWKTRVQPIVFVFSKTRKSKSCTYKHSENFCARANQKQPRHY